MGQDMQNGQNEYKRQTEQSLRLVELFTSLVHASDREELLLMVEGFVAKRQTRRP